MFWALCVDTHRGGVQPLRSSAPEPGVEPLPLPEQPLSWCIFSVFAPPPLMRSPSPARAGEAEMAGYSLPPSLRGSGQRRPIAFRYRSCSWDVFPYDLLPDRLRPMDLPLGQVSKWRAQRADRGALVFSTSLPVPR